MPPTPPKKKLLGNGSCRPGQYLLFLVFWLLASSLLLDKDQTSLSLVQTQKKTLSGISISSIAACSTKLFPTIISWHSLVCRGVWTHSNDRSQGWEGCREALFSPTWCYVWMEFRPKIKLFGKPGGFKRWNLGASSPQGNCD